MDAKHIGRTQSFAGRVAVGVRSGLIKAKML